MAKESRFGAPPPTPEQVRGNTAPTKQKIDMSFKVSPELKADLKSTAARHGKKMNEVLVEAWNLWKEKHDR